MSRGSTAATLADMKRGQVSVGATGATWAPAATERIDAASELAPTNSEVARRTDRQYVVH